jgi:glycosyltransferase involved in cell wall biosynthesis
MLLRRLLAALTTQITDALFTYSIVVADNDSDESAHPVVKEFTCTGPTPVTYCVEPIKNIALVRNKAIEFAEGECIAFIDDDECPAQDWLLSLFRAYKQSGADGILGPVKPYFESEPPKWVIKGRFFERPDHDNGYQLKWAECRTGNVLFRRDILEGLETPFRREFNSAGEDMDFFRRLINKGCVFLWRRDAIVYESVPPQRCRRAFLLKRALLRGSNFPKHPVDRAKSIIKSVIAVPLYALALVVLLGFGQHVMLKYLIKLLDHSSRLLAFAGVISTNEREV